MRKLAALLVASYFLVSLPAASATVISIGVQPSEITVSAARTVSMRFWNTPAEADAVFNVSVKDDLRPYVVCDWCGTPFVVANTTSRLGTTVTKTLTFAKSEKDFNSSIFVYAKPVGANATSTVVIQPRVEVRVIMWKTPPTTTTTTLPPTTTTLHTATTTTAPASTPTTSPVLPTMPTTTTTQESWFANTWNYLFPTTTTTTIKNTNSSNATTTTTAIGSEDEPWWEWWVIWGIVGIAVLALAGAAWFYFLRFYL